MTANKTAKIQFYEGTDEPVVPEIRLTRSKDGTTGQALFLFEKPQALSSITDGEITGMRMIDAEGEILTREVKVKFVDGEPIFLEAVYIWKTEIEFELGKLSIFIDGNENISMSGPVSNIEKINIRI